MLPRLRLVPPDVDKARRGESREIVPGLFGEPAHAEIDLAVPRRPRSGGRSGGTALDLLRASDAWHAAHDRREAKRRARSRACASAWGLSLAAA